MAAKQYLFTREDFAKVKDSPKFLAGLSLLISEDFFPDARFFRGPPELLTELSTTPRDQLAEKVKDFPLPFLSSVQDPETTIAEARKCWEDEHHLDEADRTTDLHHDFDKHKKVLNEDLAIQQDLIRKAVDKSSPEWYCYLHQCQSLAVFLLYPMLKILYPTERFYLFHGLHHTVLTNRPSSDFSLEKKDYTKREFSRNLSQPLIFDLIGQCLPDKTLEWLFARLDEFPEEYPKIYTEQEFSTWYISNFSYTGMRHEKFHQFFASIRG